MRKRFDPRYGGLWSRSLLRERTAGKEKLNMKTIRLPLPKSPSTAGRTRTQCKAIALLGVLLVTFVLSGCAPPPPGPHHGPGVVITPGPEPHPGPGPGPEPIRPPPP